MKIEPLSASRTDPGGTSARLCILATSDVHANLMPYDYYADLDDRPFGLARLATLIRDARAHHPNTILLDNGDMLQGTPISDITAQGQPSGGEVHPVISAMNHLGYDAAALGNHEFNFGLEWLQRATKDARFPYVCTNLSICSGQDAENGAFWSRSVILERWITDAEDKQHAIKLGILGVMPPQVTTWDKSHLEGRIESADMVAEVAREVPRLREKGADIVILLAHTGIEDAPHRAFMENGALPLSRIDGVDAMIAGHVHRVFPAPEFADMPDADVSQGLISRTPCVMPGFRGSHLGRIILDLIHRNGAWTVSRSEASVLPVAHRGGETVASDAWLRSQVGAAHRATLRRTRRTIGNSTGPLHSYLSLVGHNPVERLVAAAQRMALAQALDGGALSDLPILSSVAPFRAGGRGGPSYFTDIPSGPLALRHAADLYAFPNTLVGLVATGRDLRHWLESAAIVFNRIPVGATEAPLWNEDRPPHIFEVVDGLTYEIDLSQPARMSLSGDVIAPDAQRISSLCHAGRPVNDTDRFVLATNNYRAAGSGPFATATPSTVIHEGQTLIRDLVVRYLQDAGAITPNREPVWSFAPMPGTTVILRTGPGFLDVAPSPLDDRIDPLGIDDDDFLRLRLSL